MHPPKQYVQWPILFFKYILQNPKKQVAQLSQRDRAAGWVRYGQKWKTGTGRQYFMDIIGILSTTVMYLASKAIEFHEKM